MSWLNRIRHEKKMKVEETREAFIERQMMMFNFEGIGVGKAGIGFIDALLGVDRKTGLNQIHALALPSSLFDLESAQHLDAGEHAFPLGSADREARYTGVGGNQRLGQRIAMQDVHRIIEKVRKDIEYCRREIPTKAIVLAGSLGGGTGGGAIPFLAKALGKSFPHLLIIVVGILPSAEEGNVYLVNASRSFNMMWNLMKRESRYIDTFFLFENHEMVEGGQVKALSGINNEFATTFNLMFGSDFSAQTLDPQDKVMILKRGRTGISLMRYWKDKVSALTMQKDSDIEISRSDCELMMRGNLSLYPPDTVRGAQFAAYQVRCEDRYMPRDLRNILTRLVENELAGTDSEKRIPIVRGGAWTLKRSRLVELGTMIVGIDPWRYEYLRKIKDMYDVLYGNTFREDLNGLWNWRG
jgi:hypothetical protein